MVKHQEEHTKKTAAHVEEKHVEKPVEKSREENWKETLVYLRDNVVHGNPAHVERINKALES